MNELLSFVLGPIFPPSVQKLGKIDPASSLLIEALHTGAIKPVVDIPESQIVGRKVWEDGKWVSI